MSLPSSMAGLRSTSWQTAKHSRFSLSPFICVNRNGRRASCSPPFVLEVYHAKGHQQILAGVRASYADCVHHRLYLALYLGHLPFLPALHHGEQDHLCGHPELYFRVPGFHLPACVRLYGSVYRDLHCAYQCLCLCHCNRADPRHQGHQHLPHRLLYAQPDRRHPAGLHLADPAQRRSGQPAEAPAGAGCQGRFCRSGHSDVLAADRLYDDHLRGRSAERAR